MSDNEEHMRLEEKIDKVILLLTGNGNPQRGLVVRVDRVEQWKDGVQKWVDRLLWALVLAGLGLLGALIIFETPVSALLGRK